MHENNGLYKVVFILVIVGTNNTIRQEIEEFLVICCQLKHILLSRSLILLRWEYKRKKDTYNGLKNQAEICCDEEGRLHRQKTISSPHLICLHWFTRSSCKSATNCSLNLLTPASHISRTFVRITCRLYKQE